MGSNLKKWQTRSGLNFAMDEDLYYAVIKNETAYDQMETHIMAGEFFPQIMRFVATLIMLFNGYFDFTSIIIANLVTEILCTLLWFTLPLYKIPGISLLLTLIGQTVLRFYVHITTIVVLSLFLFSNWKLILFCLISGIIVYNFGALVFGYGFSAKLNNNIAKHVLRR